ncbi:MAG: ABC transporter transmembrane domain-containing protein, partial [Chloroflexota bacterium]
MENTKTHSPLRRLLQNTRRYRGKIILASINSILNKIFDLAPPVLIGAAINVVIAQEESFLGRMGIEDQVTQLVVLATLTFIVWGLESLFEYFFAVLWRNIAQTIQHELRLEAYAHVQNLELAYFEDRSTGGLLAILNDDINQLERFLDGGANDLIQVVTTMIVVGGLFIVEVPSVAWMALLPMPFVVWGTSIFQKKIAPRYADVRERNSLLNAQLSNNLSGVATIKSFTAEKFEIARISRESDNYRTSNKNAISMSAAFVPIIRMVIVTGFMAIMIFGGKLAVEGVLNIGVYSVLVFMTQRLLWPLTRLGSMLDLYQRAMASTTRVLDLLDTQAKIIDGSRSLPLADVKGAVTIENVTFQYSFINTTNTNQIPMALKKLSLKIAPGQTIAVVGATG